MRPFQLSLKPSGIFWTALSVFGGTISIPKTSLGDETRIILSRAFLSSPLPEVTFFFSDAFDIGWGTSLVGGGGGGAGLFHRFLCRSI